MAANGPMLIRTLYSGDRLIIGALVVDSTYREFSGTDTLKILNVAQQQRVLLEAMSPDGTSIQTPQGPQSLQFYTDIEIGQVSLVDSDQPARVWATGDPPELVFNFEIPRGLRGIPGQIGASPQITAGAVNIVPAGNNARANLSGPPSGMVLELDIPQGPKGDSGAAAAKATFKVGTITTGAAGSSASLAMRLDTTDSTGNTYLLDFTIPQGVKGDTGNVTNSAAGGDLTGNYPNPTLSSATKALFSPAGDAASKLSAHVSQSDPHGDRAYAAGLVSPYASNINALKTATFGSTSRSKRPYNACYINGDYDYATGAGDVFASGGWSKYSSCTDPSLVYVGGVSGQAFCYFTTPVDGRYWLHFHAGVLTGNSPGLFACTVTAPDRNVAASTIAQDQRYGSSNAFTPLDAMNEYYLTAGTKVYWAIWSSVFFKLKSSYNGIQTRIAMVYMGPD